MRIRDAERGADGFGGRQFASVVFSNYREMVRPADAKAWFAVTPASVQAWKELRKGKDGEQSADAAPSNIVALPKAAGE